MDKSWEEFFFQNFPPSLTRLFSDSPQDAKFQEFNCVHAWRLGKPVSDRLLPPGHLILVLWLAARRGKTKLRYVAKTFAEFPREEAELRKRTSQLRHHSVEEVQKQMDPFLMECRAYEHISRCCPNSHKIYFPRYFGVITDITREEYPWRYFLRSRAVVLEALKPELASRRVLAAESPTVEQNEHYERLSQELNDLALTDFERSWYISLFSDRFRRLSALHEIGITHGDVRDDHFRIPGDFFDTVLYDFSIAYTFWPFWPCLRRPRPLSVLISNEQNILREMLFNLAEQNDFRHYFANSLQLSLDATEKLFSYNVESDITSLELIVLRVMVRPDGFSMPSLASILPFLEGVRPESSSPTWHINRARLLQYYDSGWVMCTKNNETEEKTLVSLSQTMFVDVDGVPVDECNTFFLLLSPRSWDLGGAVDKLMAACSQVTSSGKLGSVLTRAEFDNL